MAWMIDTQLGRRNLSPIQRIAVAERYKVKIQKLAKDNQLSSLKQNAGSSRSVLSDNTDKVLKSVETRKEIAKVAKVGSGTLARYDVVMKSDDEELKQKMLKEEVTITNAYDTLKKKNEPTIKHDENVKNQEAIKVIDLPVNIQHDNIKEIIADMKIPKNADDYWNFMNEVECIQENFQDPIEVAFDILFERHDINGRVTDEERDIAIDCIQDVINKLLELQTKLKNIKLKGDM